MDTQDFDKELDLIVEISKFNVYEKVLISKLIRKQK